MNLRRRRIAAALFCGMLALIIPDRSVRAHGIIESAVPAMNATVPGPDVAINLRFNSRLDHKRSRLSLKVPDKKVQPLTILPSAAEPTVLSAKVIGLAAGAYVLHWQVLAVDGHMTRGNIPFKVEGR
ncbi:MAG: copper resistance CopC family protein [Rhodospirillaceae bacterium]